MTPRYNDSIWKYKEGWAEGKNIDQKLGHAEILLHQPNEHLAHAKQEVETHVVSLNELQALSDSDLNKVCMIIAIIAEALAKINDRQSYWSQARDEFDKVRKIPYLPDVAKAGRRRCTKEIWRIRVKRFLDTVTCHRYFI